MTTKAILIAAFAFCAALGPATVFSAAAGADPSYYSTLSCSRCETVATSGLVAKNQIEAGVEDGFAELHGVSG